MAGAFVVEGLHKSFGALHAVNDVSLNIEAGQVHALIGPNGAGKTTLFNCITGFLRPDAGKVFLKGVDVTDLPSHKLVKAGIVRTFQITQVFGELSARENVELAARSREGLNFDFFRKANACREAREDAEESLEVVGLIEKAHLRPEELGHGDKRVLEVAIGLALNPEVLLLDEPTAGMSRTETERIARLVRQIADRTSVLLVEHDTEVVLSISDKITVMTQGRVIAQGPARADQPRPPGAGRLFGRRRSGGGLMLKVSSLHVHYGTAHVLHGVDLEVETGRIVCLIGRNGAGKSTTLKTIMGLVPATSGEILFEEQRIEAMAAHQVARMGVAYVPEDRRPFGSLSVEENIRVAAQASPHSDTNGVSEALAFFPVLEERSRQLAGSLSGGEQQMLVIARALVARPRLILLDEPTEGLAPSLVRSIRDGIMKTRSHGLSILLVEQNLSLALEVGDYFYVLSRGFVAFEGTSEELLAREDVIAEHLGVGRVKEALRSRK